MVIWVIGQSGSGKTFFAKKIFSKIKTRKKIHIDGDEVRNIFFNNKLGYTIRDRRKNAELIQNLCRFFENKKFKVICSIQSIFPDMQKENRSIFKNYLQIYIKVPTKILMRRNNKKIYSKKNVVGIHFKFPRPYKSDYIFNNNFDQKNIKLINKIINKINIKNKK